MKKTFAFSLLCIVLLFTALPMAAYADTGPKPSVTVYIKGLDGKSCYATLLSKYASTGPASVDNGANARYKVGDADYDIWLKFVEYNDSDGFYFLQRFWKCDGHGSFDWSYYPPGTFKILLYFPKYDTFAVSNVCERYAFDSYYTLDLSGCDISGATGTKTVSAQKAYDYKKEMLSLFARTFITIAIELAVALLFGYREIRQFALFTIVNIVTQLVLNISLNAVNYAGGHTALAEDYFGFELLVFITEAALYVLLLPRCSKKRIRKSKAVLYALAANAASFALGLWLVGVMPGIF